LRGALAAPLVLPQACFPFREVRCELRAVGLVQFN